MRNLTFKILGLSAVVAGPSTVAEYDALAPKRTDACLTDAIANTMYRGGHPVIRDKFVELVAAHTGIARRVAKQGPPKKDGTTSPIYESEGKYIAFVLANKKEDGTPWVLSEFQPLMDEAAATYTFNPAEAESSGGPVGKEYMDLAAQMLAQTDKIAHRVAALEKLNPGLSIEAKDGAYDQKSLARGLAANAARKAREEFNELDA
jgi:hypothetical protein